MNQQIIQLSNSNRTELIKRGQKLEYFTIGYNSLEGLIAIMTGLLAGSIALVGFGFNSIIEVTSGLVLLWRLKADVDEEGRERLESISLRIIAVCFLALALYVGFDSIKSLIHREPPDESVPGIVLAVASLIVISLLVRAKKKWAIHNNLLRRPQLFRMKR